MQKLWYANPATRFEEALPIGNGRIGAMVYGGTAEERFSLNEDTIWTGSPYDPVNVQACAALSEVRQIIFDGQFAEAQSLVDARLMGTPVLQQMYLPAGDLLIATQVGNELHGYRRELDLTTAVASTSFTHKGIQFSRRCFASAVDNVIVVQSSASQNGSLNASIRLASKLAHLERVMESNQILVTGRNLPAHGVPAGLRFVIRAVVINHGGRCLATDDAIRIENADSAVVLIAIATSYCSMTDVSADPVATTQAAVNGAAGKPFSQLLEEHIANHRDLFDRVSIDLGTTSAAALPTDERVRRSHELDDPSLAALYFQYGRYLLISSSRAGSQPANLQGIWNEDLAPPWGSKWTININTQMNYWLAETSALQSLHEPLLRLIQDLAITGARTAREMYGARGWVCHHNTDLWRATAPVDGAFWGIWPTGGAWLCEHLWEHYLFDPNATFLARAYPLMKGASQFFVDTLVEEPSTHYMVTCPTISPENAHHEGVSITAGATMDSQILRGLFRHTAEAAEMLKVDAPFAVALTHLADRLPPTQIGRSGQIQEWLLDWDAIAPDQAHRHISHLYGLFPGAEIDPMLTPALAAAARTTLDQRGDLATGWAIAWRLNCWARLKDGDRAHRILRLLLDPSRTYPNLFDAHPPFQIDGNFGGTSGIAEMLLQSHNDCLRLLPALPSAWPKGQVSGLRARGGCIVNLNWSSGRLMDVALRATSDVTLNILYQDLTRTIRLSAGESIALSGDLTTISIAPPQREDMQLTSQRE